MKNAMTKVYTYNNLVEAEKIKEIFERNEIDVRIRSFEDSALDGVFRPQLGMGCIEVFEKDKKRAEELLNKHAPLLKPRITKENVEYKKWKKELVTKAAKAKIITPIIISIIFMVFVTLFIPYKGMAAKVAGYSFFIFAALFLIIVIFVVKSE